MLHLQALRIIFFGTSDFAAYHLYILIHCSIHKVVAVFTQEIKQSLSTQKSILSIIAIAQTYNLSLFQSNTFSMLDIIHIIKKLNADLIIVVSYGLILSQEILKIPKLGCINVHGSLLPRWRGAAPIQRALEFGDSITGISIIQMDSGIDTGNILCSKICIISTIDTSYTLSKKLARIGATLLLQTIEKMILGTYTVTLQNSLYATYAHKLNKLEARINWKCTAYTLERRIRAFNPWPISYFIIKQQHIRVWSAMVSKQTKNNYNISSTVIPGTILKIDTTGIHIATGLGILILITLQVAGKKKISAKDFFNAHRPWLTLNSVLE